MAPPKGYPRKIITKLQREGILQLCIEGRLDEAQACATRLGLNKEYAYRLARERGAIPFIREGWLKREENG